MKDPVVGAHCGVRLLLVADTSATDQDTAITDLEIYSSGVGLAVERLCQCFSFVSMLHYIWTSMIAKWQEHMCAV